jgi:tripartite ATP-independent transporter DctM subunit
MNTETKRNNTFGVLHALENGVAYTSLFLLALFPLIEVFARLFKTGIGNSSIYMHHLVLFVAFVGGMITSRRSEHLSLALNFKFKKRGRNIVELLKEFISGIFTTAFTVTSIAFVFTAFSAKQEIGAIPARWVAMIVPIGYFFMAIRFFIRIPKNMKRWLWIILGVAIGVVLAAESVLELIRLISNSDVSGLSGVFNYLQHWNLSLVWPLIVVLIASALLGVPIFVVLGGIAYLLFIRIGTPLVIVPNQAYSLLLEHSIPAIPLFTAVGFLLSESKAGQRLVRLFRAYFSWIPGGLAIVAILVSTFFTTFTGASGVTILALGALLAFVLKENKYGDKFNFGLLTSSGSVGLLFAPSLPIIIYGVTAQISIKDMFIGGIVPGLVMVLAMIIYAVYYASKNKVLREKFSVTEALLATKESVWEIFLPIIILVCYFGGLTTLVESAAVAVMYSIVVQVFIHRDIKLIQIPQVFLKCLPIIGGVLTILALAYALNYYIVDAEIPQQLSEWVAANISSKYVFLIVLNIALLITGCLMDIFSAIMIVVPLIIPLGALFGIHPVHLGIIFLANMELGYLTPPVGLNLFLASYRFKQPLNTIYRYVIPFLIIQIVSVILITYVPPLSTWLVEWFAK